MGWLGGRHQERLLQGLAHGSVEAGAQGEHKLARGESRRRRMAFVQRSA
jgi:hypothetical protein